GSDLGAAGLWITSTFAFCSLAALAAAFRLPSSRLVLFPLFSRFAGLNLVPYQHLRIGDHFIALGQAGANFRLFVTTHADDNLALFRSVRGHDVTFTDVAQLGRTGDRREREGQHVLEGVGYRDLHLGGHPGLEPLHFLVDVHLGGIDLHVR